MEVGVGVGEGWWVGIMWRYGLKVFGFGFGGLGVFYEWKKGIEFILLVIHPLHPSLITRRYLFNSLSGIEILQDNHQHLLFFVRSLLSTDQKASIF